MLVLLCLIVAAINRNFLSFGNFVRMSQDAAIPLVLGIGETFIILMGSIDLSVEGVLTLGAVILSMTVLNGMNDNDLGLIGVFLVLAVGAMMGFANGVIHVRLKVPSFMATLGTWFIGVGIANALLGGMATRIQRPLDTRPGDPARVWLSLGRLAGSRVPRDRARHPELYPARADMFTRSAGARSWRRCPAFRWRAFASRHSPWRASSTRSAAFSRRRSSGLATRRSAMADCSRRSRRSWSAERRCQAALGGVLQTFVGVLIVSVLSNGMVLMGVPPSMQIGFQGLMIIGAVALSIDRKLMRIVK